MIKLYNRETMKEDIKKLKDSGVNIWSISRINNFNNCPRGYYYTYINKKDQKDGVYSILGGSAHLDAEDLYNNKTNIFTPNNFNSEWFKCDVFGINFPSENIKNNYKLNMDLCYKYYKKMETEGEFVSEVGFLLHLDERNVIQGFIDLIEILPNNRVKIYDFKTSSYYKGDKLHEAGNQLVIYQMALEKLYGVEVLSNGWIFFKYSDIQISNNKPMIAVENKDLVKKSENQVRKLMIKEGVDTMMVDMYLMRALSDNSFDGLPENIKSQINIKTNIKQYNVTEDRKTETLNYINTQIKEIEKMDKMDIDCWKCKEQKGKGLDFFCTGLCGFYPKHCNPSTIN